MDQQQLELMQMIGGARAPAGGAANPTAANALPRSPLEATVVTWNARCMEKGDSMVI